MDFWDRASPTLVRPSVPRRRFCILIVSQLHTKCLQRAELLKFHHGGDFGRAKTYLLTHSARTSDGRVVRGHSAEVQLFERLYVSPLNVTLTATGRMIMSDSYASTLARDPDSMIVISPSVIVSAAQTRESVLLSCARASLHGTFVSR